MWQMLLEGLKGRTALSLVDRLDVRGVGDRVLELCSFHQAYHDLR